MSLFSNLEVGSGEGSLRPLALRMRPDKLEEYVGQQHLLAEGKPLRTQIERDDLSSIILWGPPGVGKTTLAHLIAKKSHGYFVPFSAVLSGIKEVRQVMEEAAMAHRSGGRTILFVDEIHRFNKAQQDAFLPHVEKGDIILIGATTENPSFEIISALLSRSRVHHLHPLDTTDILLLLQRALSDKVRGVGHLRIEIDEPTLLQIAVCANGDARVAYNALENCVQGIREEDGIILITSERLAGVLERRSLLYDKTGEEHFNLISALHKSLRNSDPDASLYWLTRMLESGEDPMYLARRLVRFASEDVGMADPRALQLSVSAMQAMHLIGMPDGALALAEAAIYLALAPRSNSLYAGYNTVRQDLINTVVEPVPMSLRNAPTKLMREEGYGEGYKYAHDSEEKVSGMECLPPSLAGRRYYQPTSQGLEAAFGKRLAKIRSLKQSSKPDREKPDE